MRIIHFLENYAQIGGAEAYAHQAITYLERIGHENVVVYAKAHSAELQFSARQAYHVPQPEYPARATVAKNRIGDIIKRERPDVAFVHHVYHPGLIDFVTQRLPAVSYVQGVYLVCPGSRQYFPRSERICPHTAGLICLWNGHAQNCIWGRNPLTHLRFLRRVRYFLDIYRRMHGVIVGSTYMRDLLQRNGLPSERLMISPTFLLEPEQVKPFREHSGTLPVILFSGRLVREKGLQHVLLAIQGISLPWRLVVAGSGPDEALFRRLAEELGIDDRVTFRGWLTSAQMYEQIEQCDIVVVTSLLVEAFGRVGPEAFLHGKPVVGYASGGIPDWLHDGVNGLLVPPADVAALRRALTTLLADAPLRERLGRQAYDGVITDYPIDKHMPAIVTMLEDAVREWGKPKL